MWFLVVFLVYPIVELVTLVWVAGLIGWLNTLLLAVLCTAVGVWQLKVQGIESWRRVSEEMRNNRMPGAALLDGVLRMSGAVLLALPGLVSSAISLVLFLAPTRAAVARIVTAATAGRFKTTVAVVSTAGQAGTHFTRRQSNHGVVDVEGWEETQPTAKPELPRASEG